MTWFKLLKSKKKWFIRNEDVAELLKMAGTVVQSGPAERWTMNEQEKRPWEEPEEFYEWKWNMKYF